MRLWLDCTIAKMAHPFLLRVVEPAIEAKSVLTRSINYDVSLYVYGQNLYFSAFE
ncbi:hypothetical protein LEP3755_07220 [Leptolyngbya sp. NIES-3755]|nr:hypothetical protein LEP3755_07220 [Leptolyngbya sp. NIES-3755]